jgi:hypothetical protein
MTKNVQLPRSRPLGMELFEITPVIVGGDAADPSNKTWLTRQQHFEAVRYWNRVIKELRERQRS